MRRILTGRARERLAAKRGGGARPIPLDDLEIPIPIQDDNRLIALSDALERFSKLEPQKAELVKLRYFVGLSFKEAAEALGIAIPTAKQWWTYSRAWLSVELKNESLER